MSGTPSTSTSGCYGRFPCPRFDESLRPGDLQSTDRYPQPKPQPQLTAQWMQKNLKDWELRKEAATAKVPLPPGVGGNPTMRQLDDEEDKIREQAMEYCRKVKKTKPRGKVSFKEPEPAAGATADMPPASTSVEDRDEDENGEQLDYYDDIGPAPYDPMDADASEDVPGMALLWKSPPHKRPSYWMRWPLNSIACECPHQLRRRAYLVRLSRTSSERVLGDLGPTVSQGSDNPR